MANLIRRTEGGILEPTRMLDPVDVMREFMQWDPFREMTTLGIRTPAFIPAFEVEETKREDERFFALERSYGSFRRSFTLPDGVDPDSAPAEMKDGVLTLRLSKKPEEKGKATV